MDEELNRILRNCDPDANIHNMACHRAADELERLWGVIRTRVYGWREWDWPEGFHRPTAEWLSESVEDELSGDGTDG